MDFGKAFTFPFEDQEWIKKLGIAGGIALVSLVLTVVLIGLAGFILLGGWMVELTRRVINRDPNPLPDWDDFGGYFSKGLQVFVVGLVYALPSILLSACVQLLPLAVQDGSADDTMVMAVSTVSICVGCLSFLYSIFLGLVLPAAIGRLAATGQIAPAFRFGEVIGMVRSNIGAYVMVLIGGFLASIISGLGIIACGIGIAFTMAYAMAINGHLYGQAYNASGGAAMTTTSGAQTF